MRRTLDARAVFDVYLWNIVNTTISELNDASESKIPIKGDPVVKGAGARV